MNAMAFVCVDAVEKNVHPVTKDKDRFTFAKSGPVDLDDDFSTTSATNLSSLSSVTLSASSTWDSEGEEVISTTKMTTSNASLPEQRRSNRSSGASSKSCPLHRRSKNSELVTLSTLQADLRALIEVNGRDHALVAHTYNLIGNALYSNDEFRRALFSYKKAVLCGEPGVHLADIFFNVGRTYFALDDMEESVAFLVRSLEVHEFFAITLGRNLRRSTAVAAIHYQLGLALSRQERPELAMKALKRARVIYEGVEGGENVALTINAMGVIFMLNNDNPSALLHLQKALVILCAQVPLNLKLVADTLCNLASAHHAEKEIDTAISFYSKAVALQKECLRLRPSKNSSLQLAITLATLADLLVEDNQLAAARESYAEAKEKNEEAGLAKSHPMQKALIAKLATIII